MCWWCNLVRLTRASPVDERSAREEEMDASVRDSNALILFHFCSKIVAKLGNMEALTCVVMVMWFIVGGEQCLI